MEKIKSLISAVNPQKHTDYFLLHKKIVQEINSRKVNNAKQVKIALAASFTVQGLKEILCVECCKCGILPSFYISDYNGYLNDLTKADSHLYGFDPDLIIIFIETKTILGDLYYNPYAQPLNDKHQWVENQLEMLTALTEQAKNFSKAKIIVHNFEVPVYSPLGILENKQPLGIIEAMRLLNASLAESVKAQERVFVADYELFCSKIGKDRLCDEKLYYLGDLRLDWHHMPNLCNMYLSYIKPISLSNRKCLVLDLDNVLWGNILAEEGPDGITLGPDPQGKPFMDLQQYLLALFNKGVILAINSHNNAEEVMQVINEHPHMHLRKEHFAAIKINWANKVENLELIAKELNIGLESMVFFDDDVSVRQMVRTLLPQVLVVDVPEDPAYYSRTIMQLSDFNELYYTKEDRERGRSYALAEKRIKMKSQLSIDAYFKGLETVVSLEQINEYTISRMGQLINKTNQFNMTTKRYDTQQIRQIIDKQDYLVLPFSVKDKVGEYGLTAIVILQKNKESLNLDTFLMSCRIIGRNIEQAILAYVFEQAQKMDIKTITAEFIPTKKNIPAKDVYKNFGFQLLDPHQALQVWQCHIGTHWPKPDYIRLVNKNLI